MSGENIKDVITEGIKKVKQENIDNSVVIAEIGRIKTKMLEIIPELAKECDNSIPFTKIKEITGFDYKIISETLFNLIMEKQILGFINDAGTDDLSDDIFIVRSQRIIDTLEPEYETG
ncbi:MAG: hypothetical protein OEZ01_18480 [Candidatus Heimdallarchaeota archaeon]|nr:hypothetical protein [Candidatus Heimdallarchaeota archaeon]MDH5648004.1 hypothetical protein [Candidatus Heimdallarchaeota archaeon]